MNYSEIIQKQRDYFNTNKTKDYETRIKYLKKLYQAIKFYEKDICKALKEDLNKSEYESFMTEIGTTLSELSTTIKKLKKWMKPKSKKVGMAGFPGKAYEVYDPYGIVLIIAPWNYPFSLSITPLIGAISAGNCAVVKPSELSPKTADVIEKVISATFEENYVVALKGEVEVSKALLEERFDYIFFTGSTNVGKYVMEKASANLTPTTLELGGKSPCIITKDANLKEAAKNIAFGKILNSGQTCIAPDYVLVNEEVRDDFLEEIKQQYNKMMPNGYLDKDVPKMISKNHFKRVVNLLENQKIYIGGNYSQEENKIEPTILIDVDYNSPVMQEEIFGPVLPVLTYKNIEEVEEFVKNREKPLALYLFTNDKNIEKRIIENLSFGGGCINDTITHITCDGLAFGGVGYSGMGRYHGKETFYTFSHKKSIYKKRTWIDIPIRYAPYNKSLKNIKKILK